MTLHCTYLFYFFLKGQVHNKSIQELHQLVLLPDLQQNKFPVDLWPMIGLPSPDRAGWKAGLSSQRWFGSKKDFAELWRSFLSVLLLFSFLNCVCFVGVPHLEHGERIAHGAFSPRPTAIVLLTSPKSCKNITQIHTCLIPPSWITAWCFKTCFMFQYFPYNLGWT